jgi:SAM-dependent methyltransferase
VTPAIDARAPWYASAFGRLYLTVYGHRDDEEARRNAPLLLKLLGAGWNARVLDVGCGEGRYARALQAIGCRVTGVDISGELLEEAHRRSPDLPGTPYFVRMDMRDLAFAQQFDAAISMFTSFGYFDSRRDDLRVFEGVRRALVPGGRFLLDFLNATEVRENLVAESTEHRSTYRIDVRRRIDERAGDRPAVVKEVRVVDERTEFVAGEFEERVRLYEPDEVDALLSEARLTPIGPRYGHLDGRPFGPTTPRLVRVAERVSPRRVPPARSADDPGLPAGYAQGLGT